MATKFKRTLIFCSVLCLIQASGVVADKTNPFAVSPSQSNPGKFVATNCANIRLIQGAAVSAEFMKDMVESMRENGLMRLLYDVKDKEGKLLPNHHVIVVPFRSEEKNNQNAARLVDMRLGMSSADTESSIGAKAYVRFRIGWIAV